MVRRAKTCCVVWLVLLGLVRVLPAADAPPAKVSPQCWDLDALTPAQDLSGQRAGGQGRDVGVLRGAALAQSKPTRVFAYYGLPKVAPGTKVPGMVLVHGGGGTAFDALGPALELAGLRGHRHGYLRLRARRLVRQAGSGTTHGGPAGLGRLRPDRRAGRRPVDLPRHRRRGSGPFAACGPSPRSIRERIGVTGISWGGYLTCIVVGRRSAVPLRRAGLRLRLPGRQFGLAARTSRRWGRRNRPAGSAGGTLRSVCARPRCPCSG